MHLINLVVELHIEAIGLDVGRVARLAGKDIFLVSTIPYIQEVALGCITRYDIVGGINMSFICNGCIHIHVCIVCSMDGDGTTGVGQHVLATITFNHPRFIGIIGDGGGLIGKRQPLGCPDLRHIIHSFQLTIFEGATAGNTVKGKWKHPLLGIAHDTALIDDLLDIHIARTDERLAVNKGELVERSTSLHTDGITTHYDAGIDLVENAICIDWIVFTCSLGKSHLLAVLTRRLGTNPDGVFDIFRTHVTQRMAVDDFLIAGTLQFARGRTVVNHSTFRCQVTDKGSNALLFQRLLFLSRSRHDRYTAREMTVADGTLVLLGYSATVYFCLHISDNTKSLEQCALTDFIEQTDTACRRTVLDGMTATVEVAKQIDLLYPVVQFNIPDKVERSFLIVDIDKLLGGIDVSARLCLEGNLGIMCRHGEREGIDIVHVVGERAVLSIVAEGIGNGDADKVLVALNAHRARDDCTGNSCLLRQVDPINLSGQRERDRKDIVIPFLDAGSIDGIGTSHVLGILYESGWISKGHSATALRLCVADVLNIVIAINGAAPLVIANHILTIAMNVKLAVEDVVTDGRLLLLIGNAIGLRSVYGGNDVTVRDDTTLRSVLSCNTACTGILRRIGNRSAYLTVLNGTGIDFAYSTSGVFDSFQVGVDI